MALINHAKREINAKIVYYGPEGVGKRDSLQYIYDRIKPSLRGELKSPSTSSDSLFFFDFSPFENPVFGDYRIRFHVYTLPGKVANPAAWKMTLKGADGLVVVADASPERVSMARDSILTLRDFLSAYGSGLDTIPCVLQLNRHSAPENTSEADMADMLGLKNNQVRFFDAASGEGVLETLSLLSREVMTRVGKDALLQEPADTAVPGSHDDASGAVPSPEMIADISTDETPQVAEEAALLSAAESERKNAALQIVLTAEHIVCEKGIVRVPLEVILGDETRRLVVSIGIEQG